MKPKLLANHNVRATVLRFVAASITNIGIALAQQAAPPAPSPVIPLPPVAPGPPATAPRPVSPAPVKADLPPPALPPLSPTPSIQPPPPPRVGPAALPGPPARTLTRNMLEEELNADPQAAAKNYEAIVSNFDRQREVAAQAIVRLGEAYRRMGRIDEARSMYARILREFVDFPDLAKVSQQLLTENAPTQVRDTVALTAVVPNPAEEEFIREELKLLEEQLSNAKALTETGQAPTSSLLPIKREILQLRQRLARARTQDSPSAPAAVNYYGKPPAGLSSQSYRSSDSRNEANRLKGEVRELENQIEVISEGKQVEAMSTQVIRDPRFAELKGDYEKKFLSATNDKESVEALSNARERLTRWIQEIYMPELKSTLAIKTSQLREVMAEAEARSKPIER